MHMKSYIRCYCTLTYDDYIIFIMFYIKLSQNFDFLTNIESVLLGYFRTQSFRSSQRNPQTSVFDQQRQVQKTNYCYPNKDNTERGSTIGGQLIMAR